MSRTTFPHLYSEVTAGIANVVEKWEFLFRALKTRKERLRREREGGGDGAKPGTGAYEALFAQLNRCDSFEDLTPPDDRPELEKLGEDTEELVSVGFPFVVCCDAGDSDFAATINEGTEKVVLHGQTMTRLMLDAKEIKMLTYVLSSMMLARNRLR